MKCEFKDANGNPVEVRPDGVHEMDACEYVEVARLRNVTISILQCRKCGSYSIGWSRQENTEEIDDEFDQ